jgi:hypothetical protein
MPLPPVDNPLQANVKRDPDGYKDEFMLQVRLPAAHPSGHGLQGAARLLTTASGGARGAA